MYNDFNKKIHATTYLESNEVSDSVIEEGIRRSHRSSPPLEHVQESWHQAVAAALEPIASYDPSIRAFPNKLDELLAAQAVKHPPGHLGVDLRPHLFDGSQKIHILCDSGSQICAWPPDKGDNPIPALHRERLGSGCSMKFNIVGGNVDIPFQIFSKRFNN